jgi:hypothetical protein
MFIPVVDADGERGSISAFRITVLYDDVGGITPWVHLSALRNESTPTDEKKAPQDAALFRVGLTISP